MDKKSKLLVYINRIDSRLRGNDAQGYTARELVHALDNCSSQALKRNDVAASKRKDAFKAIRTDYNRRYG